MNKEKPECVLKRKSTTAEGPVWDAALEVFVWIDIPQKMVCAFSPSTGKNKARSTPEEMGAVALTDRRGVFMLAGATKVWMFDLNDGTLTPIAPVKLGREELRLNDGRVDQRGRWIVGSLVERTNGNPAAGVYMFDHNLRQKRIVDKVLTSNGLAFSPDGRTLYHADSRRRIIWRYKYDPDDGAISDRRIFFQFESGDGLPDGAAVDADGGYWCAVHGGWRVCRIVNGKIVSEIKLPVAKPTMCAFGGSGLRDLIITTGSRYFRPVDWEQQPLAGSLFMVNAGVVGMPDHVINARPQHIR